MELTTNQFAYAVSIIRAVKKRGLPARAAQIAIGVALAETGLQMYANARVARSLELPHDQVGWDGTRLGLFQREDGTPDQRMDAEVSCGRFLDRLVAFDWQGDATWYAAQRVQDSPFGDGRNYRAYDQVARTISDTLWEDGPSVAHAEPVVARRHYRRPFADWTVAPLENLTAIARRYPDADASAIAQANVDRYPTLAIDVEHLEVGWTLRIP